MKCESVKAAGAAMLKEYGLLFKRHHQQLTAIVQTRDNKTYLPIQINLEQTEAVPLIELVSSDNTLMTKIIGVLSSLCVEVNELKEEALDRHFIFLSLYEQYKRSNVANQMESICSLSAFVTRCDDTLKNIFMQLLALYIHNYISLDGVELHYVFNHIGELFSIIVQLELLLSQTSLPKQWTVYRKNLSTLHHKGAFPEDKYYSMIGAIDIITAKIMGDDIVHNSIENLLSLKSNLIDKGCTKLVEEFSQYIKLVVSTLDKSVLEKPHSINMYKCIKANCLFVLISHLFGVNDPKLFRMLIDLNTKGHSIPVAGTALWFPEQFLSRYLAASCAAHGKVQQTISKARRSFVADKRATVARDGRHSLDLVTEWNLKAEEYLKDSDAHSTAADANAHAALLRRGLELAALLRHSAASLVGLALPLRRPELAALFRMLDATKMLAAGVARNRLALLGSLRALAQHRGHRALCGVRAARRSGPRRPDRLAGLLLAERALRGAAARPRRAVAALALQLAGERGRAGELGGPGELPEPAELCAELARLADCSWLLGRPELLRLYVESRGPTGAVGLDYMCRVLEDCAGALLRADERFGSSEADGFSERSRRSIDESILQGACRRIETDLRLHIHSHLQTDEANPFVDETVEKSLLFVDELRLLTTYSGAVPRAEHYLSATYYNLTTVVLSDRKTYGEMRQMAAFKFDLNTVEDNLPTQTLEQGLDVLEIMRNIHVFVSKYLYNLNNQMFIEKSSANKHLNSINIGHVANSVRAHGAGIINTTVNFTYQFLKHKFYTFSQFMYDEHIKSRLTKDLKMFKEKCANDGNMYDYKNAENFNKAIRNLGLAEGGETYLDLFRDLVTQIGNAMGYVRTVRSAGRHCCAHADRFRPPDRLAASRSARETDYFTLLVDAFAPVFRKRNNVHLNNFYVIVPPLTLNFVEHLILAKDKMSKKKKVGAAFTDDGFAMGIAYILKLLDQDLSFESLHWFESVNKHIEDERSLLEDQKAKGSSRLRQALALSDTKLSTLELEFGLLHYSLSSARVFFR